MKSIISKWVLWSFGISMIPVILLGATPGGIALSPVILMFGVFIGLVGSSVHASIYAHLKGNIRQKVISTIYLITAISLVSWQMYIDSQCYLNENEALARVHRHIERSGDFALLDLDKGEFSAESCTYTFPIKDHPDYESIIISEMLDVYFNPKL